jgi:hypothetical protein
MVELPEGTSEASASALNVPVSSANEANASVASDANQAADSEAPKPYPFSVLRVLSTSVRVTKKNLVPFFLLACALQLPVVLAKLTGGHSGVYLALLVQQVTGSLLIAVVAYGAIMELHGSRPSTGTCITKGFAQLGRVLGVTLMSTLAIAGATVFLLVPGIIVSMMLFVVVPVAVFEGGGIRAAMKRSRELTNGRKGDLFLITMLAGCLGIAIELIAMYKLGPDAAFVWRAVASAFTSMFFAVTVAVAYVELRKLRDGTQIPEIATAFARIRK